MRNSPVADGFRPFGRAEVWSAFFAAIAAGIALYLTLVHYRDDLLVCSGVSDCETVQNNQYSEIGGIPVALLGLLVFALLLALSVVRLARPEWMEELTLACFVLIVGAMVFYVYLTYLELFVIDAICQWCVASSLAALGMLVTESILLRRLLSLPAE